MGNWRIRIGRLWGHLQEKQKEKEQAPHGSPHASSPASPSEEEPLLLLEQRLGWSFRNRALLMEALTHRSYVNEHPDEGIRDNERLEFLGDAVLQLVVSADLFRRFPDWPEGRLTELRTILIRGERLAAWAEDLELGRWLRLGKGEAESARTRPSVLADAFEALLGALYLDGGLPAVERLMGRLLPEAIDQALRDLEWHDPKGRLQHWSQSVRGKTPVYRVVAVEGPPHAARFTVQVLIGDEVVGEGQGTSKREATREAARNALIRLGIENGGKGAS
ncbi:Ribonuclease 3 [Candidatus Thermoflexus japonica]|uniref:Ribonuclease 3 n=1 Tax=Candidatus Thermoflexus japonica TaxID=2035417 RepID=A0A2H5Y3K8_9CHLR|nr:Ribonuclease 3 [Candidatus Thermoflexus japonica]